MFSLLSKIICVCVVPDKAIENNKKTYILIFDYLRVYFNKQSATTKLVDRDKIKIYEKAEIRFFFFYGLE